MNHVRKIRTDNCHAHVVCPKCGRTHRKEHNPGALWPAGRVTVEEVCEACAYREPDEDAARAEHEDRRKANDDHDWARGRDQRSGAEFG